tara:strand:- start:428 stop:664 length:237 start_codon:yes stop_codon:yes gene_type:complete
MEMIARKVNFEYCSVDHSNVMLNYYKSIYKHNTVPMIVEIDTLTGQEKFIGGYTDLIKYFKDTSAEGEVRSVDGQSGV